MSKSVTRIVLAVLIGLAILLGVFATVGATDTGASRGRAVLTAGLLPDLNHSRSAQKLQTINFAAFDDDIHHCHEEDGLSPNDD